MNVLVVGGGGYIGSHVCKALKKEGHQPIVFDNFSTGHLSAVKWGPYFKGDILDRESLKKCFDDYQPQAVVHLASLIDVRESVINPAQYYLNNFTGTLYLLQTMLEKQVMSLVFSSTAAIYGRPKETPIVEDHDKSPINSYGRSKWMVEQLIEDFGVAYGLRAVSLRYFNAAGADPENEIGEAHQPETHLIPLALLALLNKRPPLKIYGIDHETPDGTPLRDYIHVTDLAAAHVKALTYTQHHAQTLALNLGTGKGHSVFEVLQAIENLIGRAVPYTIEPRFLSDPPSLIADPSQAMAKLSWKTNLSDLNTILQSAWSWHSK